MVKSTSCEIPTDPSMRLGPSYRHQEECADVAACEALIRKLVAGCVSRSHADYDDLCQVGRIAALGAARSFLADRGGFFAYAERVISNAIRTEWRVIRRRTRREHLVDLSETGHETDGVRLGPYVWDTECAEIDRKDSLVVAKQWISSWLGSLCSRDRQIIESRYYGGLSQADVARRMGLTRARVGQIVFQLLMSARVHLNSLSEFN